MGRQNPDGKNKIFWISLVDTDTHESIWSWRFDRIRGIAAVLAGAVSIIALVFCLIAFTPLKTAIPGYPDAHSKKVFVSNAIKIDSLEAAIVRWQIYADNISRVLAGEQTGRLDSAIRVAVAANLSDKTREELNRSDSLLREAVQQEEQFQLGAGSGRVLPLEGRHFFPPIKGVVSTKFDVALHPAIDVSAPANSVVSAIDAGTVVFAGWDDARGNVIILQHSGDLVSIYAHNEKLLKKMGDKVSAGASIALVGSAGSISKGDHLRFEMWYKGEPEDPEKYISF